MKFFSINLTEKNKKIILNILWVLLVLEILVFLATYFRDVVKNGFKKDSSKSNTSISLVATPSPNTGSTNQDKVANSADQTVSSPTNNNETSSTDDNSVNENNNQWIEYSNDQYGYSLKYPKDWYVDSSSQSSVKVREPILNKLYTESATSSQQDEQFKIFASDLNIAIFASDYSLETLVIENQFMAEAKKITFAGQDAYFGTSNGLKRPQIVFKKNGNIYILNYSDTADSETIAKIIETFSLTN